MVVKLFVLIQHRHWRDGQTDKNAIPISRCACQRNPFTAHVL